MSFYNNLAQVLGMSPLQQNNGLANAQNSLNGNAYSQQMAQQQIYAQQQYNPYQHLTEDEKTEMLKGYIKALAPENKREVMANCLEASDDDLLYYVMTFGKDVK